MIIKKSFFISFEGVEGAGKSVQIGLLGSKLREIGYDIVVVREPGGTRIGEEIRSITLNRDNVELTAVAEAYLMAASRAQLVREIIKPALEANKIVIADRFIDSSLAYQGYGRELGEPAIMALNKMAMDDVWPDLTVLLDIPCNLALERRSKSEKIDRLDLQQQDFYDRVCNGYQVLAGNYKKRYYKVDATKSIGEVQNIVWDKVNGLLNHL